jgi:hypothetical protein
MKAVNWIFAALVLLVMSGHTLAQGVSRAEAEAMLARLDRAVQARDTGAIAGALAENVSIELTVDMAGETERLALRKPEYVQTLDASWGLASEYRYQRNNQTFEIIGDKVVARSDVTETAVMQGQGFETRSTEVATIERVDGVPMFTKIVLDTVIKALPR